MCKISIFVSMILFLGVSFCLAQTEEELTVTTYYPSPFGVYRCLRLYPYDTCGEEGGVCGECNSTNSGTMCYNGKDGVLYICNGEDWQIASDLWRLNAANKTIYPRDLVWKVGVGTDDPQRKFVVKDKKAEIWFGDDMIVHPGASTDDLGSGIRVTSSDSFGTGVIIDSSSSRYAGLCLTDAGEGHVCLYVSDEPAGSDEGFRITTYNNQPIELVTEPKPAAGHIVAMRINADGKVGIGTENPQKKVEVVDGNLNIKMGKRVVSSYDGIIVEGGEVAGFGVVGEGGFACLDENGEFHSKFIYTGGKTHIRSVGRDLLLVTEGSYEIEFWTGPEGREERRMVVEGGGNVRIQKDLYVDGAVHASNYFDLAENFLVRGKAEEGDVVVVDLSSKKGVIKSKRPYSPLVVGVISENPAIIIGGKSKKDYKPVALKGVVLTKVIGPVKRGDILVTSDKEGYAMRADLKKVFSPTQIVGIALEELKEKEGKIRVFVK
ncbi:MAG TPA: hypothetical protein ENI31_03015 [Candidatus Omnitrophica bacterium]|nr:hypothetical protein [Candidatus Omnitrophota bacterium]